MQGQANIPPLPGQSFGQQQPMQQGRNGPMQNGFNPMQNQPGSQFPQVPLPPAFPRNGYHGDFTDDDDRTQRRDQGGFNNQQKGGRDSFGKDPFGKDKDKDKNKDMKKKGGVGGMNMDFAGMMTGSYLPFFLVIVMLVLVRSSGPSY
jgi:hypothetical protein